jgi:outer membrane protein assembly factor BamB
MKTPKHDRTGAFIVIILFAVCVLFSSPSQGYKYIQVGVNSNFLTEDGQVYFAQSGGSLTVLDLKTGNVIHRKKDEHYSDTIIGTEHGILVLKHGKIIMLERGTLNTMWDTAQHFKANIIKDYLVSYDGNGLVECRNLSDGSVYWSYNLPGALEIIAEGQYVLVHRAATFRGEPMTVLLDLDTGKEVFRKQPPPNVHYEKVFFDGRNIFVDKGTFAKERAGYASEEIVVWNISGEQVGSLSLSVIKPKRNKLRNVVEPYFIDNKWFCRGRVYLEGQYISPRRAGRTDIRQRMGNKSLDYRFIFKLPFEEEVLIESRYVKPSKRNDKKVTIEFKSKEWNWKGVLPYLEKKGQVEVVGSSESELLIGTNFGHVECIEKSTGRSLWMYIFPTTRHTASSSSPFGMPPTMTEAAAAYRRENKEAPPVSGVQLLDSTGPKAATRIIFDPEPDNPFRRLYLYLVIAWSAALLPFILLLCIRMSYRISQSKPTTLALNFVTLAFLSTCVILYCGRVSLASSITLRLSIIVAVGAGFIYCLKAYEEKKFAAATFLIAISVCLLVFIYPVFLHL